MDRRGELVGIATAVIGPTSRQEAGNRMGLAIAIDEAKPVVAVLVAEMPTLPVAQSQRHSGPSDGEESVPLRTRWTDSSPAAAGSE